MVGGIKSIITQHIRASSERYNNNNNFATINYVLRLAKEAGPLIQDPHQVARM